MTPTQLRAILFRLGLTQAAAARLVGVPDRTMRKWLAGDHDMPESAAILLRLLVRGTVTAEQVEAAQR